MIANVIPLMRTIRGKDFFDYAIPSGMTVERGSLVMVPFRTKQLAGVVQNTTDVSSATRVRPIAAVLPSLEWRVPHRLELLEWFAQYYAVSPPSALKLFMQPPLTRSRTVQIKITEGKNGSDVSTAHFELQQHMQQVLQYQNPDHRHAYYASIAKQSHGHTLCIVPEHNDAAQLSHQLTINHVVIQQSPARSTIEKVAELLESSNHLTVITTRKAALLLLHLFSTIIIDQEEAKSHKQYDSNPRYHIRTVVEQWHALHSQSNAPTVVYASHAPSLHIFFRANSEELPWVHTTEEWNTAQNRIVDMEEEKRASNYSWFSSVALKQIEASKKVLLFFNRTGEYGTALCKDCATLLPASSLECTNCKSMRIARTRKGTQAMEQELLRLFPTKRILRIDRDQVESGIQKRIADAEIVVATEKIFRLASLNQFDCIIILSVDHQLTYPHYRSHERTLQLLLRLFGSGVPTTLQTHAPHHPVIRAAFEGNYNVAMTNDLQIRRMLQLPPIAERYRLMDTISKKERITAQLPSSDLPPTVIIDREE